MALMVRIQVSYNWCIGLKLNEQLDDIIHLKKYIAYRSQILMEQGEFCHQRYQHIFRHIRIFQDYSETLLNKGMEKGQAVP